MAGKECISHSDKLNLYPVALARNEGRWCLATVAMGQIEKSSRHLRCSSVRRDIYQTDCHECIQPVGRQIEKRCGISNYLKAYLQGLAVEFQ